MSCLKKNKLINDTCGCMNGSSNSQIKHQNFSCNADSELIENFSYEPTKNMCHKTCSSISTTNIILGLLFIVFLYLIYNQIFNKQK